MAVAFLGRPVTCNVVHRPPASFEGGGRPKESGSSSETKLRAAGRLSSGQDGGGQKGEGLECEDVEMVSIMEVWQRGL